MDSIRSYTHLMLLHLWKRRTLLRMFQHLPPNKDKLFLMQHPHFSLHPNHASQQQQTHKASTFYKYKQTAYRVVKYITCAEFWGTNIIAVPKYKFLGVSPFPP